MLRCFSQLQIDINWFEYLQPVSLKVVGNREETGTLQPDNFYYVHEILWSSKVFQFV